MNRIVHILPSLRTGGAEVFTVNLLKAIDKRQFDCSLITLFTPESNNHLLQDLLKDDIKHFGLGKSMGFSVRVIFSLRSLLQKLEPSLIHSHMYTLKYVYFAYLGRRPPPWIHTTHTVATKELLRVERIIASHLYRKHISKPIAVSFNVAESVSKIYGGHEITVIHNRIPCPNEDKRSKTYYRNMLSLPTSKILLINVARMAPAKNHVMLLEAFSRLLKKIPTAHLVLIGDGVLRGTLEQTTRERGIADHVSFCGKVNDPTPYLRAADLFVLSSRREGLPVSLLEAMREGLPVVATKAGGIPEVVNDSVNGYLVNIGDTEGFTTDLIQLINSGKRTEFGRKARQRIKKDFNIETSAHEYEYIYKEAIR